MHRPVFLLAVDVNQLGTGSLDRCILVEPNYVQVAGVFLGEDLAQGRVHQMMLNGAGHFFQTSSFYRLTLQVGSLLTLQSIGQCLALLLMALAWWMGGGIISGCSHRDLS